MFSSIARLWSNEPSCSKYNAVDPSNDLPEPTAICDIEKNDDKRTRTLRHLIKLNHANHALISEDSTSLNSAADALAACFATGGNANDLDKVYESSIRNGVAKWEDSPDEVVKMDWTVHLGQHRFQRAYLDFFEDEVVEMGYHWKEMTMRYLFHGEQPLIESIMSANGRPLVRLAYGLAFSSREITMEGLALLALCWKEDLQSPALTPTKNWQKSSLNATEPAEMARELAEASNIGGTSSSLTPMIHHFAETWPIESIATAMRQVQKFSATLLPVSPLTDARLTELFIATYGLRAVLPGAPVDAARLALRSWLLALNARRPHHSKAWSTVASTALARVSEYSDVRALLLVHALQDAAQTWPEEDIFLSIASQSVEFG